MNDEEKQYFCKPKLFCFRQMNAHCFDLKCKKKVFMYFFYFKKYKLKVEPNKAPNPCEYF